MDSSTFTPGAIVMQDSTGKAIGITITYNTASNTATLTPSASLAPNTTYTVRVAGGGSSSEVKDLFGDPLAATSSWSFSTGS